MNKFLMKVMLCSAALLLIAAGIIEISILFWPQYFLSSSADYAVCNFQYSQINKKLPYKNIVIGDSRGMSGVTPKSLGNTWINLCLPGSDFFEGYTTLQHQLEHGNQIDSVILVYGLDYMEGTTRYFDIRTLPFQYPNRAEMDELDSIEKKFGTEIHSTEQVGKVKLEWDQVQRRLKYMHFPFSYRETFLDGLRSLILSKSKHESQKRAIVIAHLKESLGQLNIGLADSCNKNFFQNPLYTIDVNTYPYKFNNISMAYFDKIMRLVATKNIKTILYIAPFNEVSYNIYKNSFYRKSVDQFLGQLKIKYPQLIAIFRPSYLSNADFGDVYHVNKRGTPFFMQQFIDSLKTIAPRN